MRPPIVTKTGYDYLATSQPGVTMPDEKTTATKPKPKPKPKPTAKRNTKAATIKSALVAAQKDAKAIPKGAKNAHHGYAYTAGEDILDHAKQCLSAHGLSVVPKLTRFELINDFLWMIRSYELWHENGQMEVFEQFWPLYMSKGKGIDKAWATAATTSLAYFLRDLLTMPRGTSEFIDDDSQDVGAKAEAPRKRGARAPRVAAAPHDGPNCPKCGGQMENKAEENKRRQQEGKKNLPLWKCSNWRDEDGNCNGIYWEQRHVPKAKPQPAANADRQQAPQEANPKPGEPFAALKKKAWKKRGLDAPRQKESKYHSNRAADADPENKPAEAYGTPLDELPF